MLQEPVPGQVQVLFLDGGDQCCSGFSASVLHYSSLAPDSILLFSSRQALLTDMLLTLLVVEFISYLFFPGALCGFVIYAVNFVPSLRLLWSSSPSLWLLVSDWSSSGSVGAVDVAYSAVWLFCREFSIVRTF